MDGEVKLFAGRGEGAEVELAAGPLQGSGHLAVGVDGGDAFPASRFSNMTFWPFQDSGTSTTWWYQAAWQEKRRLSQSPTKNQVSLSGNAFDQSGGRRGGGPSTPPWWGWVACDFHRIRLVLADRQEIPGAAEELQGRPGPPVAKPGARNWTDGFAAGGLGGGAGVLGIFVSSQKFAGTGRGGELDREIAGVVPVDRGLRRHQDFAAAVEQPKLQLAAFCPCAFWGRGRWGRGASRRGCRSSCP